MASTNSGFASVRSYSMATSVPVRLPAGKILMVSDSVRTSRRTRLTLMRTRSQNPSREPRMSPSPEGSCTERNCIFWVESTTALQHPSISITVVPAVSWVRSASKSSTGAFSTGRSVWCWM